MDTEQQIRLNFLDEAEEYFDKMESNLLGLANTEIDPQQVDLVLRSAHSIKGGAAMMGFSTLSKVAHRLEDFLKILRVRHTSGQITTEVETLLLQSVDCLRDISDLNRQGIEVTEDEVSDLEESHFAERTRPIFDRLKEHLGELEAADEDALMSQDEDVDPALMIFEEGVDTVLDRFENQLQQLNVTELAEELVDTAEELIGFGNMANLEPFIELCKLVQQQAASLSSQEMTFLADKALKTWRRSHALVLRGRIEKLPSYLEGYESVNSDSNSVTAIDYLEDDALELSGLQSAFEEEESVAADFDPLEDDALELSGLQSAFEKEESVTADFDPLEDDALELSGLQSAFEKEESVTADFDPLEDNALELSGLQSAFEKEEESVAEPQTISKPETKSSSAQRKTQSVDKMVRVPATQLKQFNNLFEQLILDRNTINLQIQQFQNVITLMNERMTRMERSNTQLKKWYDRASIEGLLNSQELQIQTPAISSNSNSKFVTRNNQQDRFDTLEMDRYSDVHLICQEQIETIVQLQEVATDIELGLQEINQTIRNLNYTTKSMQGNVTRTQMLPFAEIVKRFPRVIRDLNLQFNKQVELKIIGENTLLDRSVVEALSDPLMHLLRNSFDHGIEDSQTRITAGKPSSGTITIQASNQGTYTVITLSDDGGGISLDKIKNRAMQMGIPQSEIDQIPEADLLNFIFEPGFSTAKQVTELSGRGVGMDVVRTNLQEMRGDVRVATKLGKGTSFTLRIPFTLSILRIAVVEQAGIIFAIPTNTIRELLPVDLATITTTENIKNLLWNETEMPLVEAEKILVYRRGSHKSINLTGNPSVDRKMALIVGDGTSFAALQISRFWHEEESTIRPIDSPIPLPPGIISSVVFGDGKVIPLVDPFVLIKECLENQFNSDRQILDDPEVNNSSTITTILVVDDSINVRRYLSLTLEKAGYRVEQARDGQEAVDKLVGGLAVEAVICDIEMPRLDGYGVLEEIKERPEFAYLPIAMLTSRSNEKHRKLAMNLGASAYFSKPYNEQELLNKMANLVEQAQLQHKTN
ncbi:Chemotaxis protein histidine kinase-like protein [Hyella patelloides LEGE 07179]|uniref:histidine kinase n=1 Tax=Hyella patelloides LEGE 07179 TaxID=945734 RepID=A0A563VMR0_9CYAN|nr:hybrid sensor histidine kinase/response regulator [Hyella patelloides]VEP12740.1 Chemotaxis protein histidine kinase-like protein [Hyella patelloides LEGE 07179]